MVSRSNLKQTGLPLLALSGFLFLLQAGSLFGHGAFHERIANVLAEVEKNPSDPHLWFELAGLHAEHGDLKLTLQDLDWVDALAPGKFLTELLRGRAFLEANEFAKAKEALDRQLVAHPEVARAWLLRARAEQELHQNAASLTDYREALKRTASPDPDLVQEVAGALATHGCETEAAQVLATGIDRLGKIPSLVLRALELEMRMKNFDAALRRVEDAQKDAPRPEPWMARRAAVLEQAGRIEESRAAWKALAQHLNSLPERERTSAAMSRLTEETRQALVALKSLPTPDSAATP
ncbi:MAG: hypothetical protein QOH88_3656 [Verrucomicrobiota bacterium]|jgi:tetratricopeptide (TPR) repeat protein